MNWLRALLICVLVLLLAGCRVELYHSLSEDDANQMLAILMQHHIDADKQTDESGITLRVEQSQFINAVEMLRLNGFPHRRYVTAEMVFPPNQLVVSPLEEQQKILFLKEQRIESMLSQLDGVVRAEVSIALRSPDINGDADPVSVAAFIKYSPNVNLEAFRVQIKNLIEKAIPGLGYQQISILMQPTELRMTMTPEATSLTLKGSMMAWIAKHYQLLMLSLGLMVLAITALRITRWLTQRQ